MESETQKDVLDLGSITVCASSLCKESESWKSAFPADSKLSLSECSDSKNTMVPGDVFFSFSFALVQAQQHLGIKGVGVGDSKLKYLLAPLAPLLPFNHQSSHFPRTFIQFCLTYNWHSLINHLLHLLVFLLCHLFTTSQTQTYLSHLSRLLSKEGNVLDINTVSFFLL